MSERQITIEDANIAAYLKSKGFTVIPYIKEGSVDLKVAWDVQEGGGQGQYTGSVSECVNEYYRDEPLQRFVSSLKAVRSEMYSIKNIRKSEVR